jgi:exoribonuclease R
MYLNGISAKEIHELFDSQLIDVCERATKRSRTAKQIERHCEQYCYRQYFLRHSNNRYKGSIVGFDKRNRPIIKINSYNIRIIGYEIINGKIGKNYSFEVKVSSTKNELFTAKATAVA